MQPEAFSIVNGGPVRKQLGNAVRATRIKRRAFILSVSLYETEHLAGRSLVEARLSIVNPDRLEYIQGAYAGHVRREQWLTPGRRDEALGSQVVDFVRRARFQRAQDGGDVDEIAVHECHVAGDAELGESPQSV